MNPILNKKEFEDLSSNLKDLAYSYLEKYSPSKQQLKTYLLKKYLIKFKGTNTKKEITSLIDKILKNLEDNKLVNDELYSDSKARMLLKRGYSINKINLSLRNKGIDNNIIKNSIDKIKKNNADPDFVSALKLCKKRRLGPIRPDANREIFFKKDLGVMARSGFSYEISKKVLELDKVEFEKLLKLV